MLQTWTRLKRFVVRNGDGEGSVFACSKVHAKGVAHDFNMGKVVSCEGREGVDEMTICDYCGNADGDERS